MSAIYQHDFERIGDLIANYICDSASEADKKELMNWVSGREENARIFQSITSDKKALLECIEVLKNAEDHLQDAEEKLKSCLKFNELPEHNFDTTLRDSKVSKSYPLLNSYNSYDLDKNEHAVKKRSADIPIAYLIRDYIFGFITHHDRELLDQWIKLNNGNENIFVTSTNEKSLQEGLSIIHETDMKQKLRDIKNKQHFSDPPSLNGHTHASIRSIEPEEEMLGIRHLQGRQRRRQWLVAACIVLLLGIGITFFLTGNDTLQDIPPGGSKAFLTLDNGREIIIQNALDGIVTNTSDCRVIKENGLLKYASRGIHVSGKPEYHTFRTPLSGVYSLQLSDGTKLTLNAGSSVTYPTAFTGKERRVVMTGEIYFEVNTALSPDGGKTPFIVDVKDRGVTVEVVGTKFNVNSYNDEPVRTTLDEGSIVVATAKERQLMTPGEHVEVTSAGIELRSLSSLERESTHAWRNDEFDFGKTDFRSMMNEIGRWYDIEIEFQGQVPDRQFNGSFSRKKPLSEILKLLDKVGGVKSKRIKGRKLVITFS
jgi:transmembrane sensor